MQDIHRTTVCVFFPDFFDAPSLFQGSCGSCWAHSALATIESAYLIQTAQSACERTLDLSEQQLVSIFSTVLYTLLSSRRRTVPWINIHLLFWMENEYCRLAACPTLDAEA